MADAGAGHFYFIERAVQITDLLTSELGEALEVVSRAVTVAAETPAGVRIELLNPWPTREDRGDLVVALGDLVSAQEISRVFKVTLPAGTGGRCDHGGISRVRSRRTDCRSLGGSGVGVRVPR